MVIAILPPTALRATWPLANNIITAILTHLRGRLDDVLLSSVRQLMFPPWLRVSLHWMAAKHRLDDVRFKAIKVEADK